MFDGSDVAIAGREKPQDLGGRYREPGSLRWYLVLAGSCSYPEVQRDPTEGFEMLDWLSHAWGRGERHQPTAVLPRNVPQLGSH